MAVPELNGYADDLNVRRSDCRLRSLTEIAQRIEPFKRLLASLHQEPITGVDVAALEHTVVELQKVLDHRAVYAHGGD